MYVYWNVDLLVFDFAELFLKIIIVSEDHYCFWLSWAMNDLIWCCILKQNCIQFWLLWNQTPYIVDNWVLYIAGNTYTNDIRLRNLYCNKGNCTKHNFTSEIYYYIIKKKYTLIMLFMFSVIVIWCGRVV